MASTAESEIAIWERLIHPRGVMTRETARRILKLDFSVEERKRMADLAAGNRSGTLSAAEQQELDAYCRAGITLSTLKSRARQVLKGRRRAS